MIREDAMLLGLLQLGDLVLEYHLLALGSKLLQTDIEQVVFVNLFVEHQRNVIYLQKGKTTLDTVFVGKRLSKLNSTWKRHLPCP